MRKILALSVMLIALMLAAPLDVSAEEQVTFKQATADYQAGKYQKALISFERFRERNPSNVLVRYYEGLCYQGLNALDKAREEFQYVSDNDSGDLHAKAQAGLKRLQGAHAANPARPVGASNNSGYPPDANEWVQKEGRLWNIIMYVDVNRCPNCVKFGEALGMVEKERPGLHTTKIDIETGDPSLIRFKVQNRHPFLVLVDGVDKVLWSGMAPYDKKQILNLIDRYR